MQKTKLIIRTLHHQLLFVFVKPGKALDLDKVISLRRYTQKHDDPRRITLLRGVAESTNWIVTPYGNLQDMRELLEHVHLFKFRYEPKYKR